MDIEKLTKETILKNMTPEQQKTVLESVMASVQESKKVRTQKIAENVDLVMQALGKIEAKMLARVDKASLIVETVAKNVKDGKDGRDGKDGKDGKDGVQGPKGADGRTGKDGKDGKDGRDGIDGVSVIDARIDFDGSLTIFLSNGQEINAGEVVSTDTANRINQITQRPAGTGSTSQEVLDTLAVLQAEIAALSPTLVITDTFVVNSQAAMLALSAAEKGDVAVRTDLNKTFILTQSPYSTLANWQELLTPTDAVQSVNGQTGTVVLTTTDVAEGTNQYFTNARARGALTAGTGISYNSTTGVITNSSPDQTVSLTGSGTTTVSGTYPTFTIASADQYTGTVTSVGGTGTVSGLTLSGTVTSTGSLTLGGTLAVTPSNFASQTANTVLAAPNGVAGTPTFRALVAADIPTLNQNTTGSAGSLATTGFSIVESGGKLLIKYGATTVASISSTGLITSAVNIVSNGTP